MSIVCIDRPFSHHGGHSGYKMLAKFLGSEVVSIQPRSSLLDALPQKALSDFLQLHPNWYSKDALLLEWEISKRMFRHSGNVYHFLYGENSFRRTGKANRLTGRKNAVVATYHQIPRFFEERRQQFSFLSELDAVVLVSTSQRPFFESMMDADKIHFIPHGVDVDYFKPAQNSNLSKRLFKCLTVGSNYRDMDLHVDVIKALNKTHLAGKIEFEIIGEARFASVFSGLEHVVYKSEVSDAELLHAYQTADVLLMPLQETTANNAILEALACGLPIVVSNVAGIRDYVDESCARLVPPHQADATLSMLMDLLDNADVRESLGRNARNRAEEEFDWKIIAKQAQNLCNSFQCQNR